MALLLDVPELPTDTDTLTALLPLLPGTGDAPTMTNTPAAPALSAHEAMAVLMHNKRRQRAGHPQGHLSLILRIREMTLADCDRVAEIRVGGWRSAYRG
ncbi:hypothetical protein ACFU8Q_31875, partial [Streptomyces sp. NPDC057543]